MATRQPTGKPAVGPTISQSGSNASGQAASPPAASAENRSATDLRWAVYVPLTRGTVYRDYYLAVEKFRTKEEALAWQNTAVRMVFRTKAAAAAWRETQPTAPPAVLISNSDGSVMGAVHLRFPDNSLDPPPVDDECPIVRPLARASAPMLRLMKLRDPRMWRNHWRTSPSARAGALKFEGRAVSRWDAGWRGLVEIRYLRDYIGPKFEGKSFREFFPPEAISDQPGTQPGSPADLYDRFKVMVNGRYPETTCSLGEDWDFTAESDFAEDGRTPAPPRRTIDGDAWGRGGHHFRGREPRPLVRTLAKALYELEAVLRSLHPRLSAAATADFWTSLEIERHLAEVSRSLAGENPRIPKDEIENARYSLRLQLAAYAHEIRPASSPAVPKPASVDAVPQSTRSKPRLRGPLPQTAKHTAIVDIIKQVCGPGWEATWKQNLDAILERLDAEHIGVPTRWRNKYRDPEWQDMSTHYERQLVIKNIEHSISRVTGRYRPPSQRWKAA